MKNKLLILTPADGKEATKTLDKNLNLIASYPKGMKEFYFDEIEYENFHEALEKVFKLKNAILTLGELTEYGEALFEANKSGYRRKRGVNATIQDRNSTEIVLDIDDHILPGFNPLKPEPGIIKFLDDYGINCDVTWQITASQQLNTELARIRLFLSTNKRHSLQDRKDWSQLAIESDGSVYTCSQPIYIMSPNIMGGEDPIKKRYGFIKRDRRTLILPKIQPKFKNTNHGAFSNSNYDFEDNTIPEEVLSGKVFRRYFMPLAFHYANKIQDREAIFAIISAKSAASPREFDPVNVYQYIDDALAKIEEEKNEIKSVEIDDKNIDENLPKFPANIMKTWPEPWPMIWENFKGVPRELEETLLVPTIIGLHGYFLKAKYVTVNGRRPNMFFLNLAPSTGNKDVNSKNVIESLDEAFKAEGKLINMFTSILNADSTVTADSTFLSSFNENDEFFWINTEATRIFQQIKTSSNIAAVSGLSDKLIEVVDGKRITGKNKASGKISTIEDPNCQVLFFAQPETIEKYINSEMVDSGLFGRALISIIPKLKIKESDFQLFQTFGQAEISLTEDFIDFYSDNCWMFNEFTNGKRRLVPTNDDTNKLNMWGVKEILPYISDESKESDREVLEKLLKRLATSAEQLYVIILAVCQLYDSYKNRKVRDSFPVECIFPLLNYWRDTKIYSVRELVNDDLDPLYHAILEIVEDLVAGKVKLKYEKFDVARKIYSIVPKSEVKRVLRSRTKIIQKLDSRNDNKNVMERSDRIIKMMIEDGVLVEKIRDNVKFIGIKKG